MVAVIAGQGLQGVLVVFSPEQKLIEVEQASGIRTRVHFSRIKNLRLLEPLDLCRHTFLPEADTIEVFPPTTRQQVMVEFTDGEVLRAETAGAVSREFGLFLFLVAYSNAVVRWFIPRESIRKYVVGKLIGEMLVEERVVSKSDLEAGLAKQQELRGQKLGNYLEVDNIITHDQLTLALERQKNAPTLKLGEVLIREHIISQEQLDEALAQQQKDRKLPLGQILVKMGCVDEGTIKRILAQKMGVPFVNLRTFPIAIEAVRLIPANIAQRHKIIPIHQSENILIVAMENPLAWQPLKEIGVYTTRRVDPVMASAEDIEAALRVYYSDDKSLKDLANELKAEDASELLQAEAVVRESDSAVVRVVNKIIGDAYACGASDIHIESQPGGAPVRVRLRRDGVLVDYFDFPASFRQAVISRIKIMAQLDISEHRRPQDGKIDFSQFGPEKIELRVVTMPIFGGLENVVLRILAGATRLRMSEIGISPRVIESLSSVINRPYGLLLVCGPTGSGKTTTLHSILGELNKPERKIWTAEDPVEITQQGLSQIQVNAKIGWTFAAALRSLLRADPDVIMVGEMRDEETAKVGVEASLTGHLVLSTLHTNSAAESVARLLDLGLDPFSFGDALLGVLAQRLARRLCTQCRKLVPATPQELEALADEFCANTLLERKTVLKEWKERFAGNDKGIKLPRAVGCKTCEGSGYKGRVGLHEFLLSTPEVRALIRARSDAERLQAVAISAGMRLLRQDGIEKVLQGLTNLEQVRQVCV
jgi:type II secretory ATPase GspE/PulE/Tfp pilus assembly ATPase PilB-like protein